MTIKEYQAKFVELYNQLQDEHGEVESVEIRRKTFSIMGVQGYEPIIKITLALPTDFTIFADEKRTWRLIIA